MNTAVWRLEALRLVRTHRLAGLMVLFAFFGTTGPLTSYYMFDIIGALAPEVPLPADLPAPAPADGVNGYVANAADLGFLVVAIIAAMTLSLDARPSLALFYRTRLRSGAALVLPRYTVLTAGALLAYTAGTALAWYQTAVLMGAPPAREMLVGLAFTGVYLLFVVAVAAVVASLVRGTVAAVSLTAVAVLLPGGVAALPGAAQWLPAGLARAPHALLLDAQAGDYARSLAVSLAATAVLLAVAVWRMGRREL